MDKPRSPHVIRTWTVGHKHPVRPPQPAKPHQEPGRDARRKPRPKP